MHTIVLPANEPESLERALAVLRSGGLVAFPTDTVYGVGALAFDARAVERIYRAKERSPEKSIPVLLGAVADLDLVARNVPETAERMAHRFWPGPLTLVLEKQPRLPDAVAGPTVGVRQPDHPVAGALLRRAGPLAVTSANISGLPSPCTAQDVLAQLESRVDLILDGGSTPGGIPSTVVDCLQPQLLILREGPVSLEDLKAALA